MKKITYLICLLLCNSNLILAQNCPENGFDTNPDNPMIPTSANSPYPENIGLFDWRDNYYDWFRIGNNPSELVVAPFRAFSNLNVQGIINPADSKVEDGWELVTAQLGASLREFDVNGNLVGNICGKSHPGVILYNRHTGILRVLSYINRENLSNNYQRGRIYLHHNLENENAKTNALLSFSDNLIAPLDQFSKGINFSTINIIYLTAGYWIMGDFPMAYDPCVCNYHSTMQVDIDFIANAEVTLEGTVGSEKAIDIVNGRNNMGSIGRELNQLTIGGSKERENDSYINVNNAIKATTSIKGIIDQTYRIEGDQFQTSVNGNNNASVLAQYENVEGSIPYLDHFAFLLDMFVGTPTSPSLSKTMFDVGGKASGRIEPTNLIETYLMQTPGSKEQTNLQVNDPKHPMYNEALGVFNLIETPEIEYVRYWHSDEKDKNKEGDKYQYPTIQQYKITKGIRYALNPAAKLEVEDMKATLILRYPTEIIGSNTSSKSRFIYNEKQGWIGNNDYEIPLNVNPSRNIIPDILNAGSKYQKNFLFKDVAHIGASGFGVELADANLFDPQIPTTFNVGGALPVGCFEELSFFLSNKGNEESNFSVSKPTIFVKVNLTLKRTDDPNAERIKLILPYKVNIKENETLQSEKNIYHISYPSENLKQFSFTSGSNPSGAVYPYKINATDLYFGENSSIGNTVGPGVIEANGSISIADGAMILSGTTIKAPFVNIGQNVAIPTNVTIENGYSYASQCGLVSPITQPFYITDFSNICGNSNRYDPTSFSRKIENNEDNLTNLKVNAFPNPFHNNVTLVHNIGSNENISITITDAVGRQVAVLFNKEQEKITFDGSQLALGVYFVTIELKHLKKTVKLIKQ